MSLTKRVWIDQDPAYEEVRKQYEESARLERSQFSVRLPTRRKSVGAASGRWDRLWPSCLAQAAAVLEIEHLNENEGMFFRSEQDRQVVREQAESIRCRYP